MQSRNLVLGFCPNNFLKDTHNHTLWKSKSCQIVNLFLEKFYSKKVLEKSNATGIDSLFMLWVTKNNNVADSDNGVFLKYVAKQKPPLLSEKLLTELVQPIKRLKYFHILI